MKNLKNKTGGRGSDEGGGHHKYELKFRTGLFRLATLGVVKTNPK